MPNLVGIGLSQVPTNSMLGGMAYQDPEHASIKNLDLKNLSQINAEIADTAVDVFVYDTRKDSDGGAWRKRTQNTSWYNETLGTTTRGTRREFPAVAVIVSESNRVVIYDGDDPDLPMWMKFEPNGIIDWPTSNTTRINISALNGILTTVTNDGGHLFKFVEDFVEIMYSSANYNLNSGRTIVDRNNSTSYTTVSNTAFRVYKMVTYAMNDVAMTVLPNAPIDSATGLPIPTIAVATNGGVSVIKDDGIVVDITSAQGGNYNQTKAITITEENYLWWLGDYNAGSTYLRDSYAVSLDNFPSSDFTWNNSSDNVSAGTYYALTTNGEQGEIKIGSGNTWAWNHQERNALGGPAGLAIHKPNIGSENNSLIAAITSDYNTGWMQGDIKGAFLSDTDTASNPELVTNGTFNANVDNWNTTSVTIARDTTIFSDGGIKVTTPGGGSYAYQQVTGLVSGKQYIFTARAYNPSGNPGTDVATISIVSAGYTANTASSTTVDNTIQDLYVTFTASGTTETIYLSIVAAAYNVYGQNGSIGYFDNVSVRLTEEDRSVNNNGLAAIGEIPKTPVATGADLVAYGPFAASSPYKHLVQPYNSDLLLGSGDFCITGWVNNTSTSNSVYEDIITFGNIGKVGYSSMEPGSWFIQMNRAHGFNMYYRTTAGPSDSGWTNHSSHFLTYSLNGMGIWYKITLVRRGSEIYTYVNDDFIGSTSVVGSFTTTNNLNDMKLHIGYEGGTAYGPYISQFTRMALWKISKSAPSAEQVKKMYEDEKVLFQENAKATLYGSSDAVTALAFDEVTDLLHVGTSAGRSEFQGLRRINNTTDAVTTAISASNGLVAEQ